MWRETGLLRIGILWAVSVLTLACAGSSNPADSSNSVDNSAEASKQSSNAPSGVDVNMSFAEDEAESESEEEGSSRYAPPPTQAYSPTNKTKMTAAEKPDK